MAKAELGMVGLGTMGRNFLLNVAEHGFGCAGYDIDPEKREMLRADAGELPISVAESPAELVKTLATPRSIMVLVPAGPIVDAVITAHLPHLDKGDLIIDGGNSHYVDTERREEYLTAKGIGFMGVGISGGEEGARFGPSIMPGGRRDYYGRIAPIFEAVSAKVNGEPCVAYMGAGSAGHFVKMVHNGIEYGLMQILAETYDFMLRVVRMNYSEMAETFAQWNSSELNSFLVEITAEVLRKVDSETGRPLVDVILDKAAQKGTGNWTCEAAIEYGVPVPTIDSAVTMRQISAQKEVRVLIAQKIGCKTFPGPEQVAVDGQKVTSEAETGPKAALAAQAHETRASVHHSRFAESKKDDGSLSTGPLTKSEDIRSEFEADRSASLEQLRNALLSSFIVTYAQGLSLLQVASEAKKYGLDLAEITRIWRGGCIIRSALLDKMRAAFAEDAQLPNLILNDEFASILVKTCPDWHEIVGKFSQSRIPSLCLSSGISYFEAFRSERLPANLIQAQRDFFGAHTYQRTDKEGIFHTPDWSEPRK